MKLMKEIEYGKDYRYAHDYLDALVNQGYFPSELRDCIYYSPTNRGHERVIKERLDKWRKILAQRRTHKALAFFITVQLYVFFRMAEDFFTKDLRKKQGVQLTQFG